MDYINAILEAYSLKLLSILKLQLHVLLVLRANMQDQAGNANNAQAINKLINQHPLEFTLVSALLLNM
jgi:hypothetical protein